MTWRQDQRLSFAARGLLHLLLDDHTPTTVDGVAELGAGEGRHSVCRLLRELARHGYVLVEAPAGNFVWGSERIQASADPVPEWAAARVVVLGVDAATRRRGPVPPITCSQGNAIVTRSPEGSA